MQIANRTKERSTVILAVVTLVFIGLTVLVSTAQTFRHQREAEEQHLYLTSRAVFLSVESSVRRGPVREGQHRLSPRTADFFQTLERDGDVLFVGLVDEDGEKLLTSPLHGDAPIDLPEAMVDDMVERGEWHGRLSLGGRATYVYGKRLAPLRGMHMSLRDELGPPGFLVVGIDMEKLLGSYATFRQTVAFQALYILAAALLTWGLGWSFLKRREQAGRAAALELFQARLLDNLPDGLITIDPDGLVRSVNPAALSIVKLEGKDILGRPASDLPEALAACLTPAGKPGQERHWKTIAYGRARLEVLALDLPGDRQSARMLIIRDRTELRNLEKSLADSEKLAAIGALAAGVAHEVRNPLSSLRGFAQYFVKKFSGLKPEEEYAKTMVREADRLNRVITDLLFLGRPKAISPGPVPLEPLAREIVALLRFDLEQKGVGVEVRLDAPVVQADVESLKQVLLNLLLNSLDALEEQAARGSLTARMPLLPGLAPGAAQPARPEARPEAEADPAAPRLPDPAAPGVLRLISGHAPGGVFIEVQDLGCGMSPEQQEQAFEAFVTSKRSGTGLGLALARRAMLDHGGTAAIASAPGLGCTVRLFFPASSVSADSLNKGNVGAHNPPAPAEQQI